MQRSLSGTLDSTGGGGGVREAIFYITVLCKKKKFEREGGLGLGLEARMEKRGDFSFFDILHLCT